jgi:hypothetical protein
VVGDVGAGVLGGHVGRGVARSDPLVEGGQQAEAEHPAQGGLADQQAGRRALVRMSRSCWFSRVSWWTARTKAGTAARSWASSSFLLAIVCLSLAIVARLSDQI